MLPLLEIDRCMHMHFMISTADCRAAQFVQQNNYDDILNILEPHWAKTAQQHSAFTCQTAAVEQSLKETLAGVTVAGSWGQTRPCI